MLRGTPGVDEVSGQIEVGVLVLHRMLEGDDPLSGGRAHETTSGKSFYTIVPWDACGIIVALLENDACEVLWSTGDATVSPFFLLSLPQELP